MVPLAALATQLAAPPFVSEKAPTSSGRQHSARTLEPGRSWPPRPTHLPESLAIGGCA